jgi:EAL domain-containing protein (putative c-di-GMP-specific phosphodiesterase class I)
VGSPAESAGGSQIDVDRLVHPELPSAAYQPAVDLDSGDVVGYEALALDDDVGACPASLALLPFVAPDVIKLDQSLTQGALSSATSRVTGAVLAEVERREAVVLVEGIETDDHLQRAHAYGARLG